jgi:NACalpha-BTF3-like transcription factor
VSREVLEELVQAGLSPISRLIYICGFRVIKANPDVTEIVLLEQLVLFRDTLLRLAGHKYIIIVPPQKKDEEKDEEEETVPKFSHMLPDVDLKLVMQKLLGKREDNLEDFPDANSMWGINVPQFQAEFRNIMVYKALERKFKAMIDPRVIKVLIENGFDKYPWEPEGTPVSLPLLQDSIDKLTGGGSTIATSKFMSEHLEVLGLSLFLKIYLNLFMLFY